MSAKIAVDGCTLEIQAPASGSVTITSVADGEITIGGKGVYFKEISFSLSGCTAGDITHSDGEGSGSISATGDGILKLNGASGDKVLLEGDTSDSITVNGTKGIFDSSASGTLTVKVTSAGQDDVLAL